MCNCKLKNDLGQYLETEKDSIWIYDSMGEFFGDFKIDFCPMCGENVSMNKLLNCLKS